MNGERKDFFVKIVKNFLKTVTLKMSTISVPKTQASRKKKKHQNICRIMFPFYVETWKFYSAFGKTF
jgi:hypothetical protein